MSTILHQERDASGLNLIISVDDDPIDPRREYDHLGTMVCWHRRYKLGDQHLFGSPGEFEMEMEDRPHIKLPVFLYDHSGLTLSTAPYACPWDSGQIGWILIEWHRLRAAFPKLRRRSELQAQADALLRAEVAEYDQFLTGDVWCARIEDPDGDVLDSCGGFYGASHAIAEGQQMLEAAATANRQEQAEAFVAQLEAERPDLTPPGL